jgi:UDPglucose--hexose-1-phosphate uridylyltransferase
MRYNPLSGEWVLVSPDRGERGDYFIQEKDNDPFEQSDCPFCPGNESQIGNVIYKIEDRQKYSDEPILKVIPNKYPVFTVEKVPESFSVGPYDYHSTVGAHEVIIENMRHTLTFNEYTVQNWADLFETVKLRGLDLQNDIRIKFISFFKNYGFLAGATMKHPHSQIVGMPVIPHRITEELERGKDFYEEKNRCIFCDVLKFERFSEREIVTTKFFSAFIPYASRYPFQLDIYPLKHGHDFFCITKEENYDLAGLFKNIFEIYHNALGDIPLNIILYTSPLNLDGPTADKFKYINLFYHYHIRIIPRINKYGGLECGYGLHVNPVPPEKGAKILKGEI